MEREKIDNMIPIVFITDKNFIIQTTVAITTLVNSKRDDTVYDIFIVTSQCDDEMKNEMNRIKSKGCIINFIKASTEKYSDIKQLAHIPIACLLKFEICDYVLEYDKLIYLDGDIVVRNDLSELYEFDMGDAYIAGVPSLEMLYSDKRMINAGIMLFNAKKMRDEHISKILIDKRKSLGDRGSMDQQTFNIVMQDTMKFVSWKYNFIPEKIIGCDSKRFPIESLNKLYETTFKRNIDFEKNAVIIHYATGGKPWKYNFIKCGDEWLQGYIEAGFDKKKLKRKSKIQYKKEILVSRIKKYGIARTILLIFQRKRKQGIGWG